MLKVLIAERDTRSQEFLLAVCKSKGYIVEVARNSGEALRKIQDEGIDAMFLDVNLPGMNLTDLVSVINELKKDLPVIVTADQINSKKEAHIRTKNIFYLALKPFDPDEIEKVMQAVSGKIAPDEFLKKDKIVEEKVETLKREQFEGTRMREGEDKTKILEELKDKTEILERLEAEKIKPYLKKIYDGVTEMSTSAVGKMHDVDGSISKRIKSIPVPKFEFLRINLFKPIRSVDDTVNKLSQRTTNIFYRQLKKSKIKTNLGNKEG